MIASHYAEPLVRHLAEEAPFLASRAEDADLIAILGVGDEIHMLDCSLGWAWGYAGQDNRVGYVRASALKL